MSSSQVKVTIRVSCFCFSITAGNQTQGFVCVIQEVFYHLETTPPVSYFPFKWYVWNILIIFTPVFSQIHLLFPAHPSFFLTVDTCMYSLPLESGWLSKGHTLQKTDCSSLSRLSIANYSLTVVEPSWPHSHSVLGLFLAWTWSCADVTRAVSSYVQTCCHGKNILFCCSYPLPVTLPVFPLPLPWRFSS